MDQQQTQPQQMPSPTQELEQLRTDRASGKITDQQWRNGASARFEALAEHLSTGAPLVEPVKQLLTPEQQLDRDLDAGMVGAKPEQYNFADSDPETDLEIRNAFSQVGIPEKHGSALFEAATAAQLFLETATQDQLDARVSEVTSTLRSVWGQSYESRIDAIDELVTELTARSDSLAALIDESPWIVCDLAVMRLLDNIAQARVRQRARGA